MNLSVWVCICVGVKEREREREREGSICNQSPSNMENLNPYKQKNDFKFEMLNSRGRGLRECVNYFRELERKKNIFFCSKDGFVYEPTNTFMMQHAYNATYFQDDSA